MIYLIFILLFFSVSANILLVWYIKKMAKQTSKQIYEINDQLKITLENIDQMQILFEEYSEGLKSIMLLEEYHEDEILKTAIGNTNMVIEMCKAYKKTIFMNNKEEETPQDER